MTLPMEPHPCSMPMPMPMPMLIFMVVPGRWVTLDPQFLVDRISCVVRDYKLHPKAVQDRKAREFASDWAALMEHGVVSDQLLHCFWDERICAVARTRDERHHDHLDA